MHVEKEVLDIHDEVMPRMSDIERLKTGLESEIENNPALEKFKGFWQTASGAEVGEIIGPIYLPQYQRLVPGPDGKAQVQNMPDAFIILKVLEHEPARPLTLEEARPMIAPIPDRLALERPCSMDAKNTLCSPARPIEEI